jgi:hypothetical protein
MSSSPVLLDAAGRRRSPAAMPGHNAGRPPRNKGMRYQADPPTFEEIVAVMRKIRSTGTGCALPAWETGVDGHVCSGAEEIRLLRSREMRQSYPDSSERLNDLTVRVRSLLANSAATGFINRIKPKRSPSAT